MKRLFSGVLILLLMMSLWGCGNSKVNLQDAVIFYYLRSDIQSDRTYGDSDSVIVPEVQDSLTRNNRISYYIALYLNGPSDSRLHSPFPKNLTLQSVYREKNELFVIFSDNLASLSGMDLTKACACLALTCFNLSDAQTITIQTQSSTTDTAVSFTVSRDELALEDLSALNYNGG